MKKLLLLFVFASVAFGQVHHDPLPPDIDKAVAGTVNFLGIVTSGASGLVSVVAPSIAPFGWLLLALFGAYALIATQIQAAMRAASVHWVHPLAGVVAYVSVMYRIVIAATMMSFYMVKIPGLSFSFSGMFAFFANSLANSISGDLLRQVLGFFADAIHYLPPVGMLQVMPALITALVLLLIALAEIATTVITAASLAIVGVLTCCGQLVIPFYVLPGHERRFWSWFDNMLAYAMYTFVGSAMTYVFAHTFIDFFSNLPGFSVGQWLVAIPYFLVIVAADVYCIFQVPAITHIVFGGFGGVAQGFSNGIQSLAVRAISKALA